MNASAGENGVRPPLEIALGDIAATAALAIRLAPLLRVGDVVALDGDLGAGKTTFARALIGAASESATEVPSPTFTLVQTYDLPRYELWHFDLYRLEKPADALELDIEEAFASGVSLIEWPARLGPYLPADRLHIRLGFGEDPNARHASIRGFGGWATRMAALCDE